MGSLRRRLILGLAAAALSTTPALAAVCDTLRPGWTADMGATAWWQEIWRVLASFPGLVVLGCAGLLALSERAETATLARAEGCLGSVLPAAFLLLALGAFTILRAWQRD